MRGFAPLSLGDGVAPALRAEGRARRSLAVQRGYAGLGAVSATRTEEIPPRTMKLAVTRIQRGGAGGGEFVEEAVDDALVEDALVAERVVVELEGLEFDAGGVGDVLQIDRGEVGLSGLGGRRW